MADARGSVRRSGPRVAAWLAWLVALCGAVHFAGAQPAAAPAIRFAVFSAKPIADLAFVPRPGGEPQKVQFQPTARSPRYEYRASMPVRFFDAGSGEVVAEAVIPAGVRDALLLFAPIEASAATPAAGPAPGAKGGAAPLRYQISVLDDSATRHGAGGLAIINLSGLPLSGTVGAEKVTLKPGLNPTLAIGPTAKIAFSTVFKGKVYRSYSGTATLGRNERALLILFPPFYAGSLEVQSRLLLDQPPGSVAVPPPGKSATPKR